MKHVLSIIIGVLLAATASCDKSENPPPYVEPVGYDTESNWSPDGSCIVFMRATYPSKGIEGGMFFYNLSDSSLTRFFESCFYFWPCFSPDAQWLAFTDAADKDIYRIKVNGDSLEQLTFTSDNYQPDWSPDGKRIAYHRQVGDSRGIHILDLQTKEDRLILPYAERPVWFPDGERLVVVGYNFQSGPEIAIIDTSGNILLRLTDNDAFKTNLDVSPDGSQICFLQKHPGIAQLWIINADGTGLNRITDDGGNHPSFSPDGEWIVYTHTGSNDGSLWIMRPDGSDRRQITFYGQDY